MCCDLIPLAVTAFFSVTVLHELVLTTNVNKLGSNGAKLSGCSRDILCCQVVTHGEGFTGDNEGHCVGTKLFW